MSDPRHIERTVKPRRKPTQTWFPIIAVDNGAVFIERTGEIIPLEELPLRVRTEPPSIVVAQNFSVILAYLDERLSHDDSWQYRVSPIKRAIFKPSRPDQGHRFLTTDTVCAFFGFRPPEKSKQKGHYHFPLDPLLFLRTSIDAIDSSDAPRLAKLTQWASDVREWAGANELRISATVGGIAAQLLRDPRFYPYARRKVPKATNSRARPQLPGNYYLLCAPVRRIIKRATYIDMKSAHHHCASILDFPHADKLRARGKFRVTDETFVTALEGDPWRAIGTPAYEELLGSYGLLLLHLTVPTIPPEKFPPPYMETPGRKLAYVYTNELPMIRELGGIIDGIEASWTSFHKDQGLNKYAAWALAESGLMDVYRRSWAKPILLSAYGVLASRPRTQAFGFRRANGGELRYLPAGAGRIPAFIKETLKEQELPVSNVIHRGMIEAECRLQALALARTLTAYGLRVLSIYADSVMVESGKLPLIPAPWIVKHELTRLQFFNSTSFTSVEMTKLPGIPKDGIEALRVIRRESMLQSSGQTNPRRKGINHVR